MGIKVKKVCLCGLPDECMQIAPIIKKYFDVNDIGDFTNVNMAIIVGGDGTILDKKYKSIFSNSEIPILKIHHRINLSKPVDVHNGDIYIKPPVKSLGYTMDVNMNNLDLALKGQKEYALNDVGISSDIPNKNVLLKIIAHGWEHTYLPTPKCTGVVISSAYGSSAWNLSLGGALVIDDYFECMLLSLRESPLKPDHYLVSPNYSIELQTLTPINVTYDRENTLLNKGKVIVRLSLTHKFGMVRTLRTWETLTAKLIRFNRYQYEQLT
jgi:NAD kinase